MATRTYAGGNSGLSDLADGSAFRWTKQSSAPSEVYGWVEKDHSIVKGTGGFWRTPDPEEACKRCCAAFNLEVAP